MIKYFKKYYYYYSKIYDLIDYEYEDADSIYYFKNVLNFYISPIEKFPQIDIDEYLEHIYFEGWSMYITIGRYFISCECCGYDDDVISYCLTLLISNKNNHLYYDNLDELLKDMYKLINI